MADRQAQFQAFKAEASRIEEELQYAKDRADAVDVLARQAETLIKAIIRAPSDEEKTELRKKVKSLAEFGTRVKAGEEWTPRIASKSSEKRPSSSAGTKDTRSVEGMRDLSSVSAAPAQTIPLRDPFHSALSSYTARNAVHPASRVDSSRLRLNETVDKGERVGDLVVAGPAGALAPSTANAGDMADDKVLSTIKTPTNAPSSRRRMVAPISRREKSKKEEIILLRGSLIDGNKYPPWDKNPSAAEFFTTAEFTDPQDLAVSPYQMQFFEGWLRAGKALPPPKYSHGSASGPVMHTSGLVDLVQDAATDCSVVASLCAVIARTERGHSELLTPLIWPFDGNRKLPVLSPNGKYVVRLNFNGCWRKVIIDDRLPSSSNRVLHVMDRQTPGLLYPALLEKAYLKLRGGYDFPGSNSCSDLFAFTGWVPEQIYLQEAETVPAQLWDRIYNGFDIGAVLITAGTGKMSPGQERTLGLEGQHSYAVLDMVQTDDECLLFLKNPWAEGKEWRGLRPSSAPTRGSVQTSDLSSSNTFWVDLQQLMQHFESLYLNWNPAIFGHRQDIHFQWNIRNNAAPSGGCIIDHPQFSLSVKGEDKIWLLLSRHFLDPSKSKEQDPNDKDELGDNSAFQLDAQGHSAGEAREGYMSLLVFLGNGERLYLKDNYVERGTYVNAPQSLVKLQANDNKTYTIVVDQEEMPAREYSFTLTAFSDSPVSLEPASHKYIHKKVERGSWTKSNAGGSTASLTYFDNPQYTLEVKTKGPVIIILRSGKHQNPLHVKLVLGYGKRLYQLKNRDIVADSGEYREACAVAENLELQPGLYTIICSLFEPEKTGDYSVQVESTGGFNLKPIPRDGAGLLRTKLAHACFAPTINKIAAPIVPRRLIQIIVIARFSEARSPRAQDLGMTARSPLRLSIEQGRGPDRRFFITSGGGEYSDATIVRTESVDLAPLSLEEDDLWIVLERLSSPGGPVEELYEVELFTDTQSPARVGVWREWS
ncbi:calpain-like protease palB/rim-13 [Lophiostoma macrostomum CBS 122681]|uniref:Calpain-like protease palB/rim-13 n=1 Tax=Lophiostoma macrostomum CBS 122681 TaxID=1314788 RepID=A0A6A6TNU5_9PLEO|nr:calpain-like protease palB/rim-13 [Lophiostoma macrostomum CBS 122681]